MRSGTLLDAASARALEFSWLVEAIAPVSPYGERIFDDVVPFAPGSENAAQARAVQIASFAVATGSERIDGIRDALRNAPDASGAIARASIGDVLGDANLFELMRFCDAIAQVDGLLRDIGITPIANDAVKTIGRVLETGRAGKFGFYLADGFDGELAAARSNAARAQAELDASRGRLAAAVANALGRDDAGSDEFIVMRSDVGGALPHGVRVLREAPTYFLCALEYDEAALGALERRDAAADVVATVEEAVRTRLSETVRRCAAELHRAARALGDVDVLSAAARFTLRNDCRVPEIVAAPQLAFAAGRFLPLATELEAEGRTFTPIDVALHDVAVLTGPNMGGKSVCLRTCGFIAACAAFGLPVPADAARTALFEEIAWLGIGTDDDASGGLLSSFAKEVVRLRDVLERNVSRAFVLIDEFARTTTPHEGKALLVALIERLRERGACGMVATHLAGVARDAAARHFAVRGLRGIPKRPAAGDLNEALAALAESMDYTIAEVSGGEDAARADAIALAALLGLDHSTIEAAYRALK